MTTLDAALMGILAVLTVGLVQAIKAPFGDRLDRFGPWLSVGVGCGLAAAWTVLGAEIPEGVNALAYLLVHGLAAGLSACGLYSAGRQVLTNGKGEGRNAG